MAVRNKHLTQLAESNSPRSKVHVESEVSQDYGKGIPVARNVNTQSIIRLNLDETSRIGVFGPSGSGKTQFAKALASRALKTGFKVFHGSDVKNDFQSFNYKGGASKELINNRSAGLLSGEEPESFERVMAIPYFLSLHYDKGSPGEWGTVFSLSISDLSRSEFKFLTGYHSWRSNAAQETLDKILNETDLAGSSVSQLIDKAKDEKQDNLVRKLESLKTKKLLSERVNSNLRDVLSEFENVGVFSLGLKKYQKHLQGEESFFQFYSAKTLRKLKEMLRNGVISPPVLVMMDEAHKLMPQGTESAVKPEFQDFYDISGRQLGASTLLSSQRPSQLPNPDNEDDLDFLSDSSHLFIFRGRNTLSESDWKSVVKAGGVYDGMGGSELARWRRKIQGLKRFEAVFIDSEKHHGPEDCPVVESLSPLVSHPK